MLLYYIRHGDPVYDPDSLTELGLRQAESVAKRLATFGVDRIYASNLNRAKLTATPTSYLTKKEIIQLDFADENLAWRELTIVDDNGQRDWLFNSPKSLRAFCTREVLCDPENWYNTEVFKDCGYKEALRRIQSGVDQLLKELGYEHITGTGEYKPVRPNEERVAFFAHQGVGIAFLSCLLDIPYPFIARNFDYCHTGVTVFEFRDKGGICAPTVLTHSSDSHLYRDGLPTLYNRRVRF